MKLSIREDSLNYPCSVVKLPVKQAVEGLDKLVKVTVFGNDVLTQKTTDENGLYLFFPAECQIAHNYLSQNNEYRHIELNKNTTAKPGFFEDSGRVKSIKFKGVISTGYLAPVDTLGELVDWKSLKEGDEFTDINDVNLCKKYIIKRTEGQATGEKKEKVNKLAAYLVRNQFRLHEETSQLAKNLSKFHPEDIIIITDKWHGSSCILSKVLIKKNLNLWQKLLNKIGGQISEEEYGYIYSSGKPRSGLPKGIEGAWTNTNQDYYSSNIWKHVFDKNKEKIENGISLYGEIVGYTSSGSMIQGGYDYGCIYANISPELKREIEEHKFVVYRITYTKPDGNVIEFSWNQIKDYCKKYSLETVKELYHGVLAPEEYKEYGELKGEPNTLRENIINFWFEEISKEYLEKDCHVCTNKVPAEGVVVRRDGLETYSAYKLKSKRFLERESKQIDAEAILGETNIEEQ